MPIKINGTNTAANPSITGDDTDTGIVYGSDQIDLSTGGSSKVTLNGSKLGVGLTSPTAVFHVEGGTEDNLIQLSNNRTTGTTINDGFVFGINNSLTYLYNREDKHITFGTNNLERVRIDNSGRLLIGTATQFGDGTDMLMIEKGTDGGRIAFGTSATFSECIIGQVNAYWADNKKVAAISFFGGSDTTNKDDGTIRFATSSANNLTERMRIDSAGALNINTSVNPLTGNSAGRVHITCPNGGDGINIKHLHSGHCVNIWRANGDGTLVNFYRGDSSQGSSVGGISVTSSNTSFNTSSDYRLKENATAISDGITRLKTLKPYRFNFKIDPSKTVDGFFAHEVTAVPEAVTGSKDETQNILYTEDDTIPSGKKIGDVKEVQPVYQGIDQSKLVPLLTAALQEAIAKIEVLETKVAALEAA